MPFYLLIELIQHIISVIQLEKYPRYILNRQYEFQHIKMFTFHGRNNCNNTIAQENIYQRFILNLAHAVMSAFRMEKLNPFSF